MESNPTESNQQTQIFQMPKLHSKEEKEGHEGKYDEDGFYILPGKDFFDPEGYYFDQQGYDGIGGYYDENGQYVAPPGLKDPDAGTFKYDDQYLEYADYYDELMGDSDEEEEDDTQLNQDEVNQALKKEHILPVLEWLKEQPDGKMHVIQIKNLPRQANEKMITKMIKKKIKNLKYDKFTLEKDAKERQNLGKAYISTDDPDSIKQLLNLHYHIYASYKLRTYVIGYAYDSEEDVFEDTDFQKKMMKLSLQQLQQRNIIKKKQVGTSPAKVNKDEDEKQGEADPKNGPGQGAQDDLDDMEITKL